MKKLLLFLLLAGSVFAFGQEQKLVMVEARGMGTTPDAATKDALSQAIQQAAGAIVDSQTLMKNDEIIQEKILTASNAIVRKYDVVVPVKKNRNGLYEIRIKAQVEQNLLRQKLVEHKIIAGKVEGAQNIWAEVVTQEKNQTDMVVMLENVLSKIDAERYMSFDILGKNGKLGSKAELDVKVLDNRQVSVAFGLVCLFDDKRFQKEVMPHLRRVFDSLPFAEKHDAVIQGADMRLPFNFPDQREPILQYRSMRWDFIETRLSGHVSKACRTAEQEWCGIMLNISPRFRTNSQKFICYHFPKRMPQKSIELWEKLVASKVHGKFRNISVSLCLLAADGEEIHRITDLLEEMPYRVNGAGFYSYQRGFLFISPNYFAKLGFNQGESASTVHIRPVQGRMSLEDFKEVKSFKLEVKAGN